MKCCLGRLADFCFVLDNLQGIKKTATGLWLNHDQNAFPAQNPSRFPKCRFHQIHWRMMKGIDHGDYIISMEAARQIFCSSDKKSGVRRVKPRPRNYLRTRIDTKYFRSPCCKNSGKLPLTAAHIKNVQAFKLRLDRQYD